MQSKRNFLGILSAIVLIISLQLACALPGAGEKAAQTATSEARKTATKAARRTEKAEEDIYEETEKALELTQEIQSTEVEATRVPEEPRITAAPIQRTVVNNFGEPIPGLVGKWEYYDAGGSLSFDFTIDWNGKEYVALGCTGYGPVECELDSSAWDGTTLAITFYFPASGYTTTNFITRESLEGDVIIAGRTGTGGEGTIRLLRAP
ncbi:MAG TPA: hypothetical protein PLY85_02555 [Anaerolineaceae bacterium]|nr:hypothetical protein [Anaerolineaceae bacterium]